MHRLIITENLHTRLHTNSSAYASSHWIIAPHKIFEINKEKLSMNMNGKEQERMNVGHAKRGWKDDKENAKGNLWHLYESDS